MAVRKRNTLPSLLKWLLCIILIAGIGFLLIVLGIAPSWLVEGKLIFIIPHKILGYLFFILLLYHIFTHRKWYKAWGNSKLKKTRNNQITKSVSILFLLMIMAFLFGGLLPRKMYALGHSVIGLAWIIAMMYHIRTKKQKGQYMRNQ